jgi:hypothetical protein
MDGQQGIRHIFSDYQKLNDPTINEFISSIPSSLDQAASAILRLFSPERTKVNCRRLLKEKIDKFHIGSDTLTDSVYRSIRIVDRQDTLILLAIHQPNLFAYGGVFRKIVLLQALKSRLQQMNPSQNIVSMFLIINHDFIGDFWTHVAEMPSIRSSDGVLELRYPVTPSDRWKMTSCSPPPSNVIVDKWEKQIFNWIRNCSVIDNQVKKSCIENFKEFWKIVIQSKSRATSYADFNSFCMSQIVNKIWNYDILFVNLTDLAEALLDGYKFLVSNHLYLADTVRKCEKIFDQYGIRKGVSSNTYLYGPIWLHCICGSKAPSTLFSSSGEIMGSGTCMACKNQILVNFGSHTELNLTPDIVRGVSPRAIPILLLLSRELNTSCYVTGTGGSLRYTLVASKVFKALDIPSPTAILWPSSDKYHGIGQIEAIQNSDEKDAQTMQSYLKGLYRTVEEERSSIIPLIRERDVLIEGNLPINTVLNKIFIIKERQRKLKYHITKTKKAIGALELKPCIIDYAVNFGIKELEPIWISALRDKDDLFSPVMFPRCFAKN